jgi:hypothetical protein
MGISKEEREFFIKVFKESILWDECKQSTDGTCIVIKGTDWHINFYTNRIAIVRTRTNDHNHAINYGDLRDPDYDPLDTVAEVMAYANKMRDEFGLW